jgi:hypothetical protein
MMVEILLTDIYIYILLLIPAAVRSKTWVCGRSIAETAGSNPAEIMDVRLVFVMCVV